MRSVKNVSLLLLVVIYIIAYKLFIFENYMKCSGIISASFFVLLFALSVKLLGFRKCKSNYISTNVFRIVVFFLLLAFVAMYGLGFVTGFLRNSYSLRPLTIIDNIFAPIVIIILVELFRYVVIWANKDKKLFVCLFTIILILFELTISIRTFNVESIELLFSIVASKALPIIVKNVVLSYICFYTGYKIPWLYRLVMDIYVYIFPIFPDLGEYLNSLILILLPCSIYFFSSGIVEDKVEKIDYVYVKDNFSWTEIPFIVVFIVIVCLVSGFFPLYMIGIKSNSMDPYIHKGDAVVVAKVDKNYNISKGEVIAYDYDNRVIVHRVQEVTEADGKRVYITKGDANKTADSSLVHPNQVKGIVKFKVKYLAYPAVWIAEMLDK